MQEEEDAYEILGVSPNATLSEIKKAYRKLALLHHPDKQSTEKKKEEAHVIFAKIAQAYELLGSGDDERQRKRYDRQRAERRFSQQQGRRRADDFATAAASDPFAHFHFHDPFELFERAFRREAFGTMNNDPFFVPSMMLGNTMLSPMMGGSMFQDPFFSGRSSMFGGGGDPFATMQQSMMAATNGGSPFGNGFHSTVMSTTTTTTSSSTQGGAVAEGGGVVLSQSTTTRMVNGQGQRVTETVIQRPNGQVEKKQVVEDLSRSSSAQTSSRTNNNNRLVDDTSGPLGLLGNGQTTGRRGTQRQRSSVSRTSNHHVDGGGATFVDLTGEPSTSPPERKKQRQRSRKHQTAT